MKTSHKKIGASVFLTGFVVNWLFGSVVSENTVSNLLIFLAVLTLVLSSLIVPFYKSDYAARLFAAVDYKKNTRGIYIWKSYVVTAGTTLFLAMISLLAFVFFFINPMVINYTVYKFAQSFCIALVFLAVVQIPLFGMDFIDSLIDEANIDHTPKTEIETETGEVA